VKLNPRFLVLTLLLGVWTAILLLQEKAPLILESSQRIYAFVANRDSNSVTVVDLQWLRVRADLPTPRGPSQLRLHPKRNELWILCSAADQIAILDIGSLREIARISVGRVPAWLEFSPDGNHAFVANSSSDSLTRIDARSRRVVGTVPIGKEPRQLRVSADGKLVVVSLAGEDGIAWVEAATGKKLGAVRVGKKPGALAILHDGSKVFVANEADNRVSVVDLVHGALLTHVRVGKEPADLVLKADGGEAYVLNAGSHTVAAINTWTNEVADQMLVGSRPLRGLLGSKNTLYVADPAANRVIVLDVGNRQWISSIPVGEEPVAMALAPGEGVLLVVDRGSNDLALIRTKSNSLMTMIAVGLGPADVAVRLFRVQPRDGGAAALRSSN